MSSYHSYRMGLRETQALHETGNYAQALAHLEALAHKYPEHEPQIRLWQAMIHSLDGNPRQGLAVLHAALEQGYWYAPTLLEHDPDAAGLREQPEFNALLDICQTRMETARSTSQPEILMIEPQGVQEPWPLLLALHGNHQNAHISCEYWWHAASAGWLTALPQSSQISGVNAFSWDDDTITFAEVSAHLAAIDAHYPIASEEIVLAGFSRGAEAALYMALTKQTPAFGFIAVSPGGPFTRDPAAWSPVLAATPPPEGLRGAIIVGENDTAAFDGASQLVQILGQYGVACWLDSIPGLDHNYPVNFSAHLDHALDFLYE